MGVVIEIGNTSGSEEVPDPSSMRCWLTAALRPADDDLEINIQIIDEDEMRDLNHRFRGKDRSTNVLSFRADLPPELDIPLLGDIAICAPVVAREALEQGKVAEAHWAHMLVHGTLHLLGYDHIDDEEAEEMESLETEILMGLGFPPPYESRNGAINHDRATITTPSCEK